MSNRFLVFRSYFDYSRSLKCLPGQWTNSSKEFVILFNRKGYCHVVKCPGTFISEHNWTWLMLESVMRVSHLPNTGCQLYASSIIHLRLALLSNSKGWQIHKTYTVQLCTNILPVFLTKVMPSIRELLTGIQIGPKHALVL